MDFDIANLSIEDTNDDIVRLTNWLRKEETIQRHWKFAQDEAKRSRSRANVGTELEVFRTRVPEHLRLAAWHGTPRDTEKLWELFDKGDLTGFLLNGWLPIAVPSSPSYLPDSNRSLVTQLHSAFTYEYRGDGVKWLLHTIDTHNKAYQPNDHYGRMVVYAQSSGTGKTRTIFELARELLAVLLCLRGIRPDDTNGLDILKGWPRGDRPVCQFFGRPAPDEFIYKGEEIASAFMAALFDCMADQLQLAPDILSFNQRLDITGDLQPQDSSRHQFFSEVKRRASGLLVRHREQLAEYRKRLGTKVDDQVVPKGIVSWVKELHELLVKIPGERLEAQALTAYENKKTCRDYVVIALDECTELNPIAKAKPSPTLAMPSGSNSSDEVNLPGATKSSGSDNRDEPQDGPSLLAMQRVIKACEGLKIWFILADTNAGLHETLPVSGADAPSQRLSSSMIMLDPHNFVRWDTMLSSSALPSIPQGALSLKHLKRYGRPYWHTLDEHHLIKAAMAKLVCGSTFSASNRAQVLAVFSNRISLELSAHVTTKALALDSIRSHMRIFLRLDPSGIAQTVAPSEPILALAATMHLVKNTAGYCTAVATLVKHIILKNAVLEKGHRGELYARILLIMAHDAALPNYQCVTQDRSSVVTVSLSSFLRSLLSSPSLETTNSTQIRLWEDILKQTEDYDLNFTHFYQLSQPIDKISPGFLLMCWRRGIALICTFGQPVLDAFIIGYRRDKLSLPFDIAGVYLVAIQIKERGAAAPRNLVRQVTCPVIVLDSGELIKPKHLVMLMDLGTSSHFQGTNSLISYACEAAMRSGNPSSAPQNCQPQQDTPDPKKQSQQWEGYLVNEEKRYSINIRGNDAKTYPVIQTLGPNLPNCLAVSTLDELVSTMEAGLDSLRDQQLVTSTI